MIPFNLMYCIQRNDAYSWRYPNFAVRAICIVVIFSVPMHFIYTYIYPNEREYITLSDAMNNLIINISLKKWYIKNFFFYFY